jgi:hypothetical protein
MPLIRGHHAFDDHFAQIPNDWLRDDRLSLEARGLLAQIMSHRPGWNLSIRSISAQNRIGKEKVRRIIEELMRFEYLERSEKQGKDEKGRMTSYDYITRDPLPRTAEPRTEKPHTGDRPTKKTKPIEDQTNKKTIVKEDDFNRFWSVYPKKADKPLARRSFEKALNRTTLDTIIAGAERYRDDPNRDSEFTKNPSTWLNADAWDNDPIPSKAQKLPNSARNVENFRKKLAMLQNTEVKEVENEQAGDRGAIGFSVNFRSTDSL